MALTRVHTVGGATLLTTAAVWLFFAARLSNDVVVVPARGPDTTDRRPVPLVSPPLSDEAIRELRIIVERAARGTLLTNSR